MMPSSFDHQILSKHTFGLVEPSMVEYLPEQLVTEPIVPAAMAASAHLMPRLLDLAALPDDVKAMLLGALFDAQRHGEQPLVTMFIDTRLDGKDFVRYWNALQVQADRKQWLRLHDPRVLHQLLRILPTQQQGKLFNRIASISYWLGDSWITAVAEPARPPDAVQGGLRPAWDWSRVERIGIVNRALHGAGVYRASDMGPLGQLAEQAIARAVQVHRLSAQADLVEFAIRALNTTPRFDEHPAVRDAIRASSDPQDDACLSDRLALIDEQVWAELGQAIPMESEST